jgi:YfiH family protein
LKPELFPYIPAWPGVKVFCTTRTGGSSLPPYDSFNVGDHVGDDAQAVFNNRQLLTLELQQRPVFMRQVHGSVVAQLHHDTPDGQQADACFTQEAGVACAVMVADCLPILFYSARKKMIAAVHAGWRGLAGEPKRGGVLEAMRRALVSRGALEDVQIWLGPCIGPRAFEVGPEVREAFLAHDALAASAFKSLPTEGKYLCDLALLARQRLADWSAGEIEGNDSTPSWCTFENPQEFFSHRRDGVTGRFAAGIALLG